MQSFLFVKFRTFKFQSRSRIQVLVRVIAFFWIKGSRILRDVENKRWCQLEFIRLLHWVLFSNTLAATRVTYLSHCFEKRVLTLLYGELNFMSTCTLIHVQCIFGFFLGKYGKRYFQLDSLKPRKWKLSEFWERDSWKWWIDFADRI